MASIRRYRLLNSEAHNKQRHLHPEEPPPKEGGRGGDACLAPSMGDKGEIPKSFTVDQVIKSLSLFKPGDLQKIKSTATYLLQTEERAKNNQLDTDWLLDAIIHELNGRGLGRTVPPHFRIKSMSSFQGYPDRSRQVRDWLVEQVPEMHPSERAYLARISAWCLAESIQNWGEVSLQTMLRYVGSIPQALERQFPGYIAAGLLKMVAQRGR